MFARMSRAVARRLLVRRAQACPPYESSRRAVATYASSLIDISSYPRECQRDEARCEAAALRSERWNSARMSVGIFLEWCIMCLAPPECVAGATDADVASAGSTLREEIE
jgi:hypothetical protein